MITIYHNPRCGKSRSALVAIQGQKEAYTIVEYLKDTPTIPELTSLIALLGISPKELIRTKEPIYLDKFKDKVHSDAEWIEILHQYPILIERPIVVRNAHAVIARTDALVAEVLK